MRRIRVFAIATLFALAACTTAHQPQSADAPLDMIAHGHRIAQHNCSGCHAIGTFGQSPNPAAPPFLRLSESYPIDSLDEAFAEGIVVGHSGMPHFRMSVSQIDALTAYLRSIQTHRSEQPTE